MEIGDVLWLECCENTKSGEIRPFLEVALGYITANDYRIIRIPALKKEMPRPPLRLRL
jgi:hypothetical protein